MGLRNRQLAWVAVAFSLAAVSAVTVLAASGPDSTVFKASAFADTYVSSVSPDTTYGSQQSIWVANSGSAQSSGLASFDIRTRLGSSVVVSARVKLQVSQTSGTQFPATMVTGRLTADFSEATTTYNSKPGTAFDTSTNTLFDNQPDLGKAIFIDVTKQLMAWRATKAPTFFGIVLTMDRATVDTGIAFASRENPDLGGPLLQVFLLPPGHIYGYSLELVEMFAIPTTR